MTAVDVGQRAPDFELPAADRDGIVSLAPYRGKAFVLLTLFRGLYCPFCRRQMAQLSPVAERLRPLGIETVAVVATAPERARLYFRLHPPRYALGADPDLVTHRAYGLPAIERNDAAGEMVERAAQRLAGELGIEAPPGQGRAVVDAADGFERLASDAVERTRHQIQLLGQFLIDRDGVIRWRGIEGRANYAEFPSTSELVSLAERVRTPAPIFDGGSDADRRRILEVHEAYLHANAAYDWPALKATWSDDPSNVFFNMNGHTYVGLEHWTRLWQYYAQHKESGWWEPFDVKVIVRGDMAVVTCHRKTTSRWKPGTGTPDAGHVDKAFISRSTMVLVREHGDWKTVHVHFSEARDTPRPGGV